MRNIVVFLTLALATTVLASGGSSGGAESSIIVTSVDCDKGSDEKCATKYGSNDYCCAHTYVS